MKVAFLLVLEERGYRRMSPGLCQCRPKSGIESTNTQVYRMNTRNTDALLEDDDELA
jgi:hypothetical protein